MLICRRGHLLVVRYSHHRIWIENEHVVAMAADDPVTAGHTVIVPKQHVPSIHTLEIDAQKAVWGLVGEVRSRLRSGLVPDGGFALGFVDGLSTMDPVPHAVIHVVPLRKDAVDLSLPECSEWIHDDGYSV